MDAADFISLAVRLSGSRREADLRTAVSRAYYGAFHLACGFVEDCGVRLAARELYKVEAHQKVRFCLDASRSDDAELVAEKLSSLRQQRNEADYDLDSLNFKNSSLAGLAIRAAQEIVDGLQRCRAEPELSDLRARMATYARDVLRLPVD